MLAPPHTGGHIPRPSALPVVLLVSLALWAGIVCGVCMLLGLM